MNQQTNESKFLVQIPFQLVTFHLMLNENVKNEALLLSPETV